MTEPSFTTRIPEGDDIARKVCETCGYVAYENPKIVVGAVVRGPDRRILLCRRAIEPRKGFWTIPAGYLELNETPEEGAAREAWEEAGARFSIERLLAIYSIQRISQVQLIFRANQPHKAIEAGPESQAVGWFATDAIPWDLLAFPSVHWALTHDGEAEAGAPPAPFANPEGATGAMMPDGRPVPKAES